MEKGIWDTPGNCCGKKKNAKGVHMKYQVQTRKKTREMTKKAKKKRVENLILN